MIGPQNLFFLDREVLRETFCVGVNLFRPFIEISKEGIFLTSHFKRKEYVMFRDARKIRVRCMEFFFEMRSSGRAS